MLTIKAPIELTCSRPLVSSQESFYHRIAGNYEMMAAGIDREDLLHVVTAPPEIYLGEGGMTSLVNNTRIQNRQENKIEVINNVLNRIALTEDVNLTYQDRVYITDVLHKLGIRDARQFMTQVRKLKQETSQTEQLISLYWNHLDELTQMVEEYQIQTSSEEVNLETSQEQVRISLHEKIMKRLQTGAVYQILNNFYTSHAGSDQYMTSQELRITEQKRVAAGVLLHELKNVVGKGEVPLVFHHENYYESQNFENTELNEETVNSRITSAVLLSLVDNLYQSRFERQLNSHQTWLHMEQAFYQTAENTLQRLKTELTSQYDRDTYRESQLITRRELVSHEIQAVRELLRLGEIVDVQPDREKTTVYELSETGTADRTREEISFSQPGTTETENLYVKAEQKLEHYGQQNRFYQSVEQYLTFLKAPMELYQEFYREDDRMFTEPEPSGEKKLQSDRAGESRSADSRRIPDTVLERWESRLEKVTQMEPSGEQAQESQELYQPEIPEQFYTESYENHPGNISQEIQEFHEKELHSHFEEQNLQLIQKQENAPQFVNAEENLELLEQQLSQINRRNVENYNRYQQFIRQQAEMKQADTTSQTNRMRQESLKALTDPTALLEQYRMEETVQQQKNTERLKEFTRLLPEETRRIFERFEQLREMPGQAGAASDYTRNNLGLLIHDIQEVEQVKRISGQTDTEHTEQIHEVSEKMLEKWQEKPEVRRSLHQQTSREQNDISLIHKAVDNRIDEEMLEQLLQQNRMMKNTTKVTEQQVEEKQIVQTKTQQQTRQTVVQENQDLNELIQRGVQRQMGAISDQIFSKLEKRLQNEKKRRGY